MKTCLSRVRPGDVLIDVKGVRYEVRIETCPNPFGPYSHLERSLHVFTSMNDKDPGRWRLFSAGPWDVVMIQRAKRIR